MSTTFDRLRAWRKRRAAALGKPAFAVFGDRVLRAVADAAPGDARALAAVRGVGPQKLADFGDEVLQITRGAAAAGASARALPLRPRTGAGAGSPSASRALGSPSAARALGSPSAARALPLRPMVAGAGAAARAAAVLPPPPGRLAASARVGGLGAAAAAAAAAPAGAGLSADALAARLAKLNSGQRQVVRAALAGRSMFFHGAAGTGKSFTLSVLIASLRQAHGADAVAVTAPTGIAAVNVGGTTVHKFVGAGLCKGDIDKLVGKVSSSGTSVARWRATQVLVIDEVSMLTDHMLTLLDACGRAARGARHLPFGGLQMVVSGDFFQLPPVTRGGGQPPFAFLSPAWRHIEACTLQLTEVVRQKEEQLVRALNSIRMGRCDAASVALMASLSRPLPALASGVLPTRLYSTNRNVDAENETELARLPGVAAFNDAVDVGDSKEALAALDKGAGPPKRLLTKIGAQVVLLRGMDDTLVNGSRGVVVGYASVHAAHPFRVHAKLAEFVPSFGQVPVVLFDNGRQVAVGPAEYSSYVGGKYGNRLQIPIKLAFALTVHKSQGMSLSRVEVDLSDAFDFGQCYVALSRAVSTAGLRVRGFDPARVKAHPLAVQFYARLQPVLAGLRRGREGGHALDFAD